MFQRFEFTKVCMGKNVNRHFSRNFDIFSIKMTYLNALLSLLLPLLILKLRMALDLLFKNIL